MRRALLLVATLAAGLGGCMGAIGDPVSQGGDDPTIPTGAVLTPMKRLTGVEYENTVRDLFPGATLPELDLPEDDDKAGFENLAATQDPSPLVIDRYWAAAGAIATAVSDQRETFVPCELTGPGDSCGGQFVEAFGARAFRRPLDAEERMGYLQLFEAQRGLHGDRVALQLVVQAFLQSPQFLYRLELGDQLTAWELASRLSYFLWGSMPDQALFDAAAAGALNNAGGLETEVRRMLDDPRARVQVAEFHRQWLGLDELDRREKDLDTYPMWSDALRESMKEETYRFVVDVIFDGLGTVDALLTDRTAFVDAELAEVYGVAPPASGWAETQLPADQRAGLLTRTAFLTSRAHAVHPSPVKRGVFVFDRLLCAPLQPPPPDVNTDPPEPGDGEPQTNRERYLAHRQPNCVSCHERIDGIGFGFEAYDSVGAFRELDNGFPVDDTSVLVGTDVDGAFEGAVELSERLTESDMVERCVVTQWFRFAFGRLDTPGDDPALEALYTRFVAEGHDVRELIVAIATSAEFRTRTVLP